jgi:hypothetical protein
VSPLDRHLTTEQLSALLDNQLTPDESEESYQAHLQTCEQCQQELSALRQTVRLLREMPQPPLPRSFTLPPTFSIGSTELDVSPVAEPAMREPVTQLPRRVSRRDIRRVSRRDIRRVGQLTLVPVTRRPLRTAMRVVSGLVAVIGICFILTGFFSTLKFSGGSMSAATTSNSSEQSQGKHPNSATPAVSQGSGAPQGVMTPQVKQSPTPTPTTPHIQPAQRPIQSTETPSGILSTFTFFDVSTTAGKYRLGILLLVLGAIGFLLFRQRKKRYRPQTASRD